MVTLAAWLIWVAPSLFLIPNYLWMSQLCQPLDGVKLKWILYTVPEGLRKLVAYSLLLFLERGTLLGQRVPSWC